MEKDQRNKLKSEAIECAIILAKAMQDAGGTVLSMEDLKKMSLHDFIVDIAAQNNIRFVYHRPPIDSSKVVVPHNH